MASIDNQTIEDIGVLAKLELSPEEKENAIRDMREMITYIDKMAELDTTDVEPLSHILPLENVFREDVVTNGDESEKTLSNAPRQRDNLFAVPRTFD